MKINRTRVQNHPIGSMIAMLSLISGLGACDGNPTSPTVPTVHSAPGTLPPPPPVAPAPTASAAWYIWTDAGGLTAVAAHSATSSASPHGVNAKGEVVGSIGVNVGGGNVVWRSFIWSASRGYRDLGGTMGQGVTSIATAIDDASTVVGYSEGNGSKEGFVWAEGSGVRSLGIIIPYIGGITIESGVVAGNARGYGNYSAPYRRPVSGPELDVLPFSSEAGGAVLGMNSKGEAVGYDGYMDHGFGGSSDAVAWDAEGTRIVAMSCGEENNCFAYLHSINEDGVAVGSVRRGEIENRVFRWTRSGGVEFLALPAAGWDVGAVAISDNGSILAYDERDAVLVSRSGAVTRIEPPAGRHRVYPMAMSSNGIVVLKIH